MGFNQVNLISVPVTDQEEAKDFYVHKLGFVELLDYPMGEEFGRVGGKRWIMLAPPGGGAAITLTTWFDDLQPGVVKLAITCDDVDQTHRELTGRGVAAESPSDAPQGGRQFGFSDPDGNHWLVTAGLPQRQSARDGVVSEAEGEN